MSVIAATVEIWKFNRVRTLATLDAIAELSDPAAVLSWRPGPERAHIAWQLMHVAVTEELFATSRLNGSDPSFADLVERFKGGSTPDDDIPSIDQIRDVLGATREHILGSALEMSEEDLTRVPEAFKERGWNIATLFQIVAWHEPHHQGQAHATLNAWKAANP